MKKKTPEHLKPFETGQLCYVVYRRHKGRGPYKLLLHEADSEKFGYGHKRCWVVEPPKMTVAQIRKALRKCCTPAMVKHYWLRNKTALAVSILLLLCGCAAPHLLPKAVVPSQLSLAWDWTPNSDNPWSNVVFNVRSSTTLAGPCTNWPIMAVVTTNRCPFTVNKGEPCRFYVVTASNTVTHFVSP